MNKLIFRTNAKCAGCTAKIDIELGKSFPQANWSFDLSSPERTLTVTGQDISAERIIEAVASAGYRAEILS